MNGPKGSSVEIERKVFIFWFISRIESSLTKRDVKSMWLYVDYMLLSYLLNLTSSELVEFDSSFDMVSADCIFVFSI
jgi:hypothetical protein